MNFEQLAAPFAADAIHWRAQTLTGDGSKALALAYLDARDVQDRLDAVAGPANWRDSYIETPKGRLLCTLELRIDGEWVGKSDGAGDTDVEGDKGAISDALKRAAVKWGIGRYLYDLGNTWAPCETWEKNGKKMWKAWKPEAMAIFARALGGAAPKLATVKPNTISDDQIALLIDLLEANNIPVAQLLKSANVAKLPDIHAEQFDRARAWVDRAIKAKLEKEAA